MQRRLEPELMNGDTQVQAYAAADFSSGDQATIKAIQRLLSRTSPLPPDPLVVDLGCGPGNITLRLAGLFPKARIIGIDGAESMLAVARERAQQQQLEISFLCQTLQEVLRGALLGQADLIVSNSLLHHLHQPDLLWMVTRNLAAPGCRTCTGICGVLLPTLRFNSCSSNTCHRRQRCCSTTSLPRWRRPSNLRRWPQSSTGLISTS